MPRTLNLTEARAALSRLVDEAATGEEWIIAKDGRPMARLVPLEKAPPERRIGLWQGRVQIGEDFDSPLPDELLELFGG